MSKGEVAEGSLTPKEEDSSVRPTKQSVPGWPALGEEFGQNLKL